MFFLDSADGRFVAIESRDHSIYRPHGFEAARALGLAQPFSYGPHWQDNPDLRKKAWTVQAADSPELADVVSGLDIDGGSWLAFHRRTGVYCRIFTPEWDDHTRSDTAGNSTAAELIAPGGLSLDCATAASAEHAVELLRTRLVSALGDSGTLFAFHLVIADPQHAFVVAFDSRETVTVTPMAAGRPQVLTTAGPAGDEFGRGLQQRAETAEAPGAKLTSWAPWLSVFAGIETGAPDYSEAGWTADRYSAIRPPYRESTDADRYKNVTLFPVTDPRHIAWTKSVSIYSAGQTGAELFAYNERQLFEYQPVPADVRRMGFPTTPDDFFVVIANTNS
ncbi:hypothetical protein V7968_26550 [Nocardia vulneris]|uniref:hypothetical protein n=1 Tax=Nocardia vulneris TaxID=1141657 RepID=UPI0030D0F832